MPGRVDGFGVSLEFDAAGGAGPDVFVRDGVVVFGRHADVTVRESVGRLACPSGEVSSSRL